MNTRTGLSCGLRDCDNELSTCSSNCGVQYPNRDWDPNYQNCIECLSNIKELL